MFCQLRKLQLILLAGLLAAIVVIISYGQQIAPRSVSNGPTTTGLNSNSNNNKKELDCSNKRERLDDCGLAQGFSFIFDGFQYPTNQSSLLKSCKRQSEAFKCLKQYAKCLSPLSRQVLSAIIAGRIKYNKRLCAEQLGEFNGRFIDTFKCMSKFKQLMDKGARAEVFAATVSEAIAAGKIESSDIRLKHACCAVSEIKRQYIDSSKPNCGQFASSIGDLIDSYLADSIGIICPDFDKGMQFCDKIPKLNMTKEAKSKFFILPVIDVVQMLAN